MSEDSSSSSSEEEEKVKTEEEEVKMTSSSNCFFSLPGMKTTEVEEVEEKEEEEEEKRPKKKRKTENTSEKQTKKGGKLPSAMDMFASSKDVSFLKSKRKGKEGEKIKSFEKRTETREASEDESTDEECPNLGQVQRYQHKRQKEYRRKRPVGGDWAYRVEVGKNYLQDQADENDIEDRRKDKSFSKRKWWNEDW
jgi:hypothetical protein